MAEDSKKKQSKTGQPAKAKARAGHGRRKRKGMCLDDRPCLEPNAGGIDTRAYVNVLEHGRFFVAVPPDREESPVRVFDTFTEDLQAMARWLKECRIATVAMESTGVYWIPLYDVLEAHGIKPCLTNARHMKNAPGQRTDWHACACARCVPVAAIPALCGIIARGISARSRGMRRTSDYPASR